MALIDCPECGKKVASSAPSCPSCGASIAGRRLTQIEGANAFVMLGSCIVGLVLAVLLARLPGEDNVGLRVALGIVGLVTPPAAALAWSSRRHRE